MKRYVLIGPTCAGKTTVLPLLADLLGVPGVELDDIAEQYYLEAGRGEAALKETTARVGVWNSYLWWQDGHVHAVERAMADHPGAVIALGAGHSVYTDPDQVARISALLAPCTTVLLLPSPDLEHSLEVIRERNRVEREYLWVMDGHDLLADWVQGPQNHALADLTVYTEGRTPEQTAQEVASIGSDR